MKDLSDDLWDEPLDSSKDEAGCNITRNGGWWNVEIRFAGPTGDGWRVSQLFSNGCSSLEEVPALADSLVAKLSERHPKANLDELKAAVAEKVKEAQAGAK